MKPRALTGTNAMNAVMANRSILPGRISPAALAMGFAVAVWMGGEPVAAQEAGEVFQDCDMCPQMVVVPGGRFGMGSPETEEGHDEEEGPRHVVAIELFAVGVYQVTFEEWDACAYAGGCGGLLPEDEGWGRGDRPAINVSWEDAQGYVAWLSETTGEEYRLLTEAQWEYVARAGTQTARYWGEDESAQCRHANGGDTYISCLDGYENTAPVGSFDANAFGLYDVLGNIWEWTEDCWNDSYAGAPNDGSAWRSGDCSRRVLRGGSFTNSPAGLRSAQRSWGYPEDRIDSQGFRVARIVH